MAGITETDILGGVHAPVSEGKIQSAGKVSEEASKKASGGSLDKDAFLQLLVTQMKYQDPLEPTDNTEYVSQLATFSSLEEMQNISSSMDKSRASSLVGQYVYLTTKDSTGNAKNVEGIVDYVSYQGNKTFLSIGGELYNFDDLTSVADSEYTLATQLAEGFIKNLNSLPKVEQLTEKDLKDVQTLVVDYSSMNSYQKSFISQDDLKTYAKYAEWYAAQIAEKSEE